MWGVLGGVLGVKQAGKHLIHSFFFTVKSNHMKEETEMDKRNVNINMSTIKNGMQF